MGSDDRPQAATLIETLLRLEAAAAGALAVHAPSYRSLKSILENGLDHLALEVSTPVGSIGGHANVRGAGYFTEEGETR